MKRTLFSKGAAVNIHEDTVAKWLQEMFDELYSAILLSELTSPLYIGNGDNKVKIATNGHISLEGTATVWEDISEPLTSKNLDSVPGTADYSYADSWIILEKDGLITNDADTINVSYQLKHATKNNSTLKVHLHWKQTSSTVRTITGKYRIQKNGQATTTAWQSFSATTNNSAYQYVSGDLNQITNIVDVPLTDVGLSDIVQVRFTRSDSNNSADMYCFMCDAHYEVDSLGSNSEYVK